MIPSRTAPADRRGFFAGRPALAGPTRFLALLLAIGLGACRPLPTPQAETPAPPAEPVAPAPRLSFEGKPMEAAIVCAHPLAAEAGRAVLAAGGTAADAAVAALLALNVVEPHASGLGGGGFLTMWSPEAGLQCLDFREQAPAGLLPEAFFDPADSLHLARVEGGTSVAVPGTPAGLAWLHREHGRLPLPELAAPAIALAEDGYPVSPTLSGLILERADLFLARDDLGVLFLVDGLPPMEGDTLRNPGLANWLRETAEDGFESFYQPPRATRVATAVQAAGGWIDEADLAGYRAIEREPIQADYRGWTFAGPPPPATGALALLETLNILEPMDLERLDEPRRLHLLAEAMKKAMRDRAVRCADPAFHAPPLDSLLDKDYARGVLAQIHWDGIHDTWPPLGSEPVFEPEEAWPATDSGNTTHIVVWDSEGRVISLTQSINHFFGAAVAVDGLLLNDEIDDFTWTREDSRNGPEPGKRPRSSMAPVIALKDGEPVLALGTPGGARIVSAMIQIVVGHVDLGLPLEEAIDAPRFHPLGSTLVIEPRFSPETTAALEETGYRLYPLKPRDLYFGGAHGIRRLDGPAATRGGGGLKGAPVVRLAGGADARRDGVVAKLAAGE